MFVPLFEDIFNNAPIGYHSLNLDGFILMMNDTELNWLGYTREELIGQHFKKIICPTSRDVFDQHFPNFKKTGSIKNFEFELRRKDGSCFPVMLNATAIFDENQNFVMTRSTIVDITLKKQLEKELKEKNEQLYSLNQEKNKFIGIASHDLQNPITNLRLLAAKFRKTAEHLTEKQLAWVEEIESTALGMSSLIKDILNVNKIELEANTPVFIPIDIINILQNVFKRFEHLADRKHLRLNFESDQSSYNILSDAEYITEIFENLISNAIKFSPIGKTVSLKVNKKEDFIEISVKDEGLGIKPEELHLLFGKFQKLSTRPTAGETSTGLGLSIVKEYVEVLGGCVTCQSEYGSGANFIVRLPIVGI